MAVSEHQDEDIGAERDRLVGLDVAQGGGCQVIGIEAPGGVDGGICEAGESMIYGCLGRAWILGGRRRCFAGSELGMRRKELPAWRLQTTSVESMSGFRYK